MANGDAVRPQNFYAPILGVLTVTAGLVTTAMNNRIEDLHRQLDEVQEELRLRTVDRYTSRDAERDLGYLNREIQKLQRELEDQHPRTRLKDSQ